MSKSFVYVVPGRAVLDCGRCQVCSKYTALILG